MTKPVLGLVLGALLGCVDGSTALFYDDPDVRKGLVGIILGSTFKGFLTGLAAGLVAKKKDSLAAGITVGALVGFVLSGLVVWIVKMEGSSAGKYPFSIILPGMAVGVIAGFATQRYGKRPVA